MSKKIKVIIERDYSNGIWIYFFLVPLAILSFGLSILALSHGNIIAFLVTFGIFLAIFSPVFKCIFRLLRHILRLFK